MTEETFSFGDFGFEVALEKGGVLIGGGDLGFDIQKEEICQRKELRARPKT